MHRHDPEEPVDLFDEVGLGLEAAEAGRDAERELARVRPDLDGRSTMALLGPGAGHRDSLGPVGEHFQGVDQ
jgi:hypothetical protein